MSALTTPKKVTKKAAGIPLTDTNGVTPIKAIEVPPPRVMAMSAMKAPKPKPLAKEDSSSETESSSTSDEEFEESKF